MGCDYKLTYKPEKKKAENKVFSSENELDAFLEKNFDKIIAGRKELEKYAKEQAKKEGKKYNGKDIEDLLKYVRLFDESGQDAMQAAALEAIGPNGELRKRLNALSKTLIKVPDYAQLDESGNVIEGEVDAVNYPTLAAVTAYIESEASGKESGRGSDPAYNSKEYRDKLYENILNKKILDVSKGITSSIPDDVLLRLKEETTKEVEKIVSEKEITGTYMSKIGDDVHKIMETLALRKSNSDAKFPARLKVLTKYDVNKDSAGNIVKLGEGKTVFEEKFDEICKRYNFSDKAQFFPEFQITSKYINKSVRTALKEVLKNKLHGAEPEGFEGKIDLLVIDKGKAYIFDWKTTSTYFGDWMEMDNEIRRDKGWVTSARIDSNTKQVALYAAMLESWGIDVAAAELVPFHVEMKTDAAGNLIKPNVKVTDVHGKQRYDAADTGENVVSIKPEIINNKQDSSRSSVYRIMQLALPRMRTIVNQIKPIEPQKLVDIDEDMKFCFGTTNGLFSEEAKKYNPKYYRGYNEAGRKVYEDRIKPLSAKSAAAHPGMKYAFYISSKVDLGYGKGETVYFNENYMTSDGKTVDQILEKYCEELEKVKSAQYTEFANGLVRQMQQANNDEKMFEEIIRQLCGWDQNKIKFIKEHFGKYTQGDWMLANDPSYIDNGIFMFYNNDAVEIVSLTSSPLFAMKNYGTKWQPNNTILGNLGVPLEECDPYTTMTSTHANMLMMRVMDIISKNQNAFPGKKIRDIKVVNPFMKQASWTDIDFINDNWTQMCAASKGKLKLINKSILYSSVEAATEQAKEICKELSLWDNISDFFKKENINRRNMVKLLKVIKQRAASGSFDKNGLPVLGSRDGYAYYCIQNMLLLDYKIRMPFERDGGKIFESGIFPTGYMFNQPGRGHSVIVRALDDLTNNFRVAYSSLNNARIDGFQKDIKAIYDDFGFNPNTSTRKRFFEQFFEQENGTVSRKMRIKNFGDPFWDGHRKAMMAFAHILDSIAAWRGEIRPDENAGGISIWESTDPDRYYEVPLIDAGLMEYITREGTSGGIKGITEAIKNKIKQKHSKINSILFSEFDSEDVRDKDPIQYGDIINNRYVHDNEVRDKLTAEGRGVVFSTDLELIIGMTNLAQALSETSASYGPVYAAAMAAIGSHQSLGGLETPELSAFVNDYVKRIYHGESLIDDSLKLVNGLLGFVKSFSSALALKFNTRAFSREMLVSFYNGLAEAGFERIPGVSAQDFAYGLWYTIKQAPAEVNKRSLVGYLNRAFQLAGQSRSELGTANFITDLGAMTFDKDKVGYATSSLPDSYYRVGILIAKMHADGCLDAYEKDGDDWRYNPKKDKRYAKYLEGEFNSLKFKDYDPSMGSKGEYTEARALWNESVEAWRSALNDDTITQPQQAYTPSEIGGIQEKAEDLYGAFDVEHKSLMCSTFIGSMVMQFKTFISSQVNRWIKQGGHVNTWQRMHVKDKNGKKLFIYASTAEEIAAGQEALRLITEDEITDDMHPENIMPYIKQVGTYTEGELMSTLAFCDAIVHLDGDGLKKLWANPVKRYGLIQGLMNTLGMLLFAGLVRLMFGEDMVEHKSEQPFYSQWAYGVLMGFAEDGPIWQCVGGLVSDFNPPALLSMQRLCQTTKSVILGNKTLPEGVLQSMGATREFSGMFAE